jgi:multisubunit Na+/H+ antiporter MnhG subunit
MNKKTTATTLLTMQPLLALLFFVIAHTTNVSILHAAIAYLLTSALYLMLVKVVAKKENATIQING